MLSGWVALSEFSPSSPTRHCHPAEFKNLTTLDVGFVTVPQLKDLRDIKYLPTKLYLGHTKITDAGLAELRDLKNLTTLTLGHTNAGFNDLQKSLPNVQIIR